MYNFRHFPTKTFFNKDEFWFAAKTNVTIKKYKIVGGKWSCDQYLSSEDMKCISLYIFSILCCLPGNKITYFVEKRNIHDFNEIEINMGQNVLNYSEGNHVKYTVYE